MGAATAFLALGLAGAIVVFLLLGGLAVVALVVGAVLRGITRRYLLAPTGVAIAGSCAFLLVLVATTFFFAITPPLCVKRCTNHALTQTH